MNKKIRNAILIFTYFLYIFILISCQSTTVSENDKLNQTNADFYKDKVIKFYSSIGFEYTDNNSIFLNQEGDSFVDYYFKYEAEENTERSHYLIRKPGEGVPRKFYEFIGKSWESKRDWENSMISLSKKDFGTDPFLHKEIEEKYKNKFSKNAYFIDVQNFRVEYYDLNKEIYKVPIAVSDLLYSSESKKACKREYEWIEIPLKKSDAEKLRFLNSLVYIHLRKLPKPDIARWISETCVRPNQFAPRGCLQFKNEKYSSYVFKSQVLKVSFIGADDYTFGTKFSVDMPFSVSYKFEKKQPLLSCNK